MRITDRRTKVWTIVRVSSGNFRVMYDFMVFGYYASAIGKVFFPTGNAFGSLMLVLMTFGAAFLMRPVGAIAANRKGRSTVAECADAVVGIPQYVGQ